MMSCCSGCESGMGCSSHWGLSGLMGVITQGMGPLNAGGSFSFGFNPGYARSPFMDFSTLAGMVEAQGLSYNTQSFVYSGSLNPYVVINGNANQYWDSATDLANQILGILQANSVPVDVSSIQFQAEPCPDCGSAPPPMVGLPAPPSGSAAPPPPPGQCNFSQQGFGTWIACELGIKDPITGALIGSAGTAVGIGVLALVAILLIKK
jgi:hypothetical protein